MICGRIWSYQRMLRDALGPDFGNQYTSITTMFVESAFVYAVVSVLNTVTFAIGHPINQIWLGIAPAVQVSTVLIIERGRPTDYELVNHQLSDHLSCGGRQRLVI